jgi:iron complex transport system substrate-binding protein
MPPVNKSSKLVDSMMRVASIPLLTILLAAGCNRSGDAPSTESRAGCIDQFDPLKDYFPYKAKLEFAEQFSVEYHKTYKVVTVRNPAENVTEKYVLLQCGATKPPLEGDLANAPVVSIPIRSLFAGTATQIALLAELDRVNVLSGVAQTRYVTIKQATDWIAQGHVTEYAGNDVVDTELVISKAPDLLMQSGGYAAAYSALRKAGVAVVANVEWQEPTALGRAEWLKYMALFLNEEEKAQRSFDTVRDRYAALRERTKGILENKRPLVMTGTMYRGTFGIAGGQSYVARMIADAGGRYIWQDNPSTGVASVDLETQLARGAASDVWINGNDWKNLKAMLAEEERYKEFRPFQRGNVWMYNRLVNENGGLDYWARGLTRPDLILGDLIKIFHPDLAKDHEFMWYKQVPAE